MHSYCSHFRSPKLLIAVFTGICILLLANTAFAASRITFIALINNQLALLPASWTIYKKDDKKNPIATLERHSGTLSLPSGDYYATLKLKQETKTAPFRVEPGVDSTIAISVD